MCQHGFLFRWAVADTRVLHEHDPAKAGRFLDPSDVRDVLVLRNSAVLGERGQP